MSEHEALEAVVDAVEETLDLIEDLPVVMRNNPVTMSLAVVGSAAVAAGVTFLITRRVLTTKFDQLLQGEIQEAKEFYSRLNKTGDFGTPESAAAVLIPEDEEELVIDAAAALQTYQGKQVAYDKVEPIEEPEPPVIEKLEVTNIFVNGAPLDEDFDWEAEQQARDREKPYVINHTEYDELSEDYVITTLTYYEGDGVLSDEHDKDVEDIDETVGLNNMGKFGHGSRDNNVVYIRNEKTDMVFEVLRSTGSYAKEVLGIDPEAELRHSAPRRFRGDDG